MASSNRVFVSPGVYTSEKDLTFVAQSVGVTTLGLVGETLKGPAFEPILISDYNEFKQYFGGSTPVKDGNGNPKYELPYVAKSYLEESNQLFVTKILGLTGYKPVKTFAIKTIGGVELGSLSGSTSGTCDPSTDAQITGSTFYEKLSGITTYDGETFLDYMTQTFSSNTNANDGQWFVIGLVPENSITGLVSSDEEISPLTGLINSTTPNGKEWYNQLCNTNGTEVYSYLFVYTSGGTGTFNITQFTYNSTLLTDYNNQVVVSFRSRGSYSGQTLLLETTGNTQFNISGNDLLKNPLAEFTINVTGSTSGSKSFTCSMDTTSSKYITKVLGTDVFDKPKDDIPIYVHETYPNFLSSAYKQGYIRGLSLDEVYVSEGNNFATQWDTPLSPMVVSEVRGGKVSDLFQVITVSDGNSANEQIKISIININIETGEFDLLVRDFNDTDENQVVIEKFSRCSMNPDLPGYIARKVGTSDTEYELRSKYIMLNMASNHPVDAFPAGFKGFVNNSSFSGSTLGSIMYKNEFYDAGDIVGYNVDGSEIQSSGDKVKKISFGLSSQIGYDKDLFKFKGTSSITTTSGFHLSVNAAPITGTTFITTPYNLESQTGVDNVLTNINYRKFTFAVCGGYDGWDIYRQVRTYSDQYIFGKQTYVSGSTSNGGLFSTSVGNSDYYSYLQGINTFSNPESVNINIFATPGINFYDHSSLTSQAIDIMENDRADSLYIIAPPNYSTVEEVVDALDNVSLDTNYSATYWPWIQVRDADNATQLFIPPTGEVVRNIALTDNVSFPWFAVAGYSRGLVKSIKAVKKLTLDERDELYKNRINPIATFSDTGTIIWGNKTLQVRESALDRINVRRLLLRARKLISAVAVRLLFEQNDEQVRNEFLRLVNPILEAIKRERGLYEFRVTVSNEPEDIDANTLRGKIYIKPTRSLEFIDVEFIITPTGASFDNI
jgi:hypothetical protein